MKNREVLSTHRVGLKSEIFLSTRKAGHEAWSHGREATHVAHFENFPSGLPRPDFITLEVIFKLKSSKLPDGTISHGRNDSWIKQRGAGAASPAFFLSC